MISVHGGSFDRGARRFPSWLSGLATWWRRCRGVPLYHLQFVFYTRQGCHLCEAAWRQLQAVQHRYQCTLQAVDVDGDPQLAARYGTVVPVVTVNGKLRFRGGINSVLLDRLLRAEKKRVVRML